MLTMPPANMTAATDTVTVNTQDDYGYISDTYTYPALPIKSYTTKSVDMADSGCRRYYVGTWWSNPNEMRNSDFMFPQKAYGTKRVFPTQEGHCFSCLEANIRFDVDVGYDSPSNIAEKITTDIHSANASVQKDRNYTTIVSRFRPNFNGIIPQLAAMDEDTCSCSINGMPGLIEDPTGFNIYGAMFGTNNPFYLTFGSRLLSKYTNDGGSGPKSNDLMNVLAPVPGAAHDNDIYCIFDLPFNAGPPAVTVIPDNYLLVTTLPYNESSLQLLHKFLKTQKICELLSTPLTTNDLESQTVKPSYFFPFNFGRGLNSGVSTLNFLQSPLLTAAEPSVVMPNMKARVFFDESKIGDYVLPDDFLAEDCRVDDDALITYEGIEYTAINLARKLDVMIRCINTGGQGNNQLCVAFSMKGTTTQNKRGYGKANASFTGFTVS